MVNGGFKYSKESKLDYTGKKRLYANIKKVNEHLDNMAQELLKEQKNQMLLSPFRMTGLNLKKLIGWEIKRKKVLL